MQLNKLLLESNNKSTIEEYVLISTNQEGIVIKYYCGSRFGAEVSLIFLKLFRKKFSFICIEMFSF